MSLPVVLVTGATRGIGRAVVDQFASDHHVLVGGRDPEAVAQVVSQLPSAAPFVADLTDAAAVESAVAAVERLDVLVLSAGVEALGTSEQVTRDEWTRVLEMNVTACVDLTRLLLPRLRESAGIVVPINSGAGHRANPQWGAYAASKHALRAWADALRQEERGRIRVSAVHPGRVNTDMQRRVVGFEGAQYQEEKYLRPESVARAVRFVADQTEDACIDELSIRTWR